MTRRSWLQTPGGSLPARFARTCSGRPERYRSQVNRDGIIAAYIMVSGRNGTLYTGVTSDLARRAYEHREGVQADFTRRYGVKLLVWYEVFELITEAMRREHTIKGYPRRWKLNLIEGETPGWADLYERLNG